MPMQNKIKLLMKIKPPIISLEHILTSHTFQRDTEEVKMPGY